METFFMWFSVFTTGTLVYLYMKVNYLEVIVKGMPTPEEIIKALLKASLKMPNKDGVTQLNPLFTMPPNPKDVPPQQPKNPLNIGVENKPSYVG